MSGIRLNPSPLRRGRMRQHPGEVDRLAAKTLPHPDPLLLGEGTKGNSHG